MSRTSRPVCSLLFPLYLSLIGPEFGPGNYSYLGMQCCDAAANVFNAPVVEAPCSWVVNNETVNLGYSANWYADSSKSNSYPTSPTSLVVGLKLIRINQPTTS